MTEAHADSLRVAWLGPVPGPGGGAAGVATELLAGLVALGHRIDCFMPGSPDEVPARLRHLSNLTFVYSAPRWEWGKWYSRNGVSAFVTGLWARRLSFRRLRAEMARRHAQGPPYDCVFQFSNIETVGVPTQLRSVPLVIHPSTHAAGELRWFIAERRLARRCQPWYELVAMGATLFVRAAIQRRSIKRARLVICISSVFRDHLIRDYGIDRAATRVIPNPIDLSRFGEPRDGVGEPAVVLVLGRIAVRKGIDQIVDLSHILAERGAAVRIRILGSGGLWSDYRPLLVDVDASVATYGGGVAESDVPAELHRSDVLIQASKYEPFALTVGEALASGVPVVATTEVGAIEGTSPMATEVVAPGDAEALADGLEKILKRLRGDVRGVRLAARSDAERLFAPETVCAQISDALRDLVAADRRTQSAPSDEATANATPSR